MNTNLIHIQNSFTKFSDFGIASFSINPEYDTVDILNQYANENGIVNSNWNLMTGDRSEIYKLANDGFNLYTAASSDFIDGFEHSGYFALIDKQGFIRCRNDEFGNPKIYYKGSVNHMDKLDLNELSLDIGGKITVYIDWREERRIVKPSVRLSNTTFTYNIGDRTQRDIQVGYASDNATDVRLQLRKIKRTSQARAGSFELGKGVFSEGVGQYIGYVIPVSYTHLTLPTIYSV